jgi:predicted metal-dependent peptidase
MVNIEAEEKMKKARIKLFSRSPFFSYLALFLKFREDTQGRLKSSSNSMGVGIDGTLLYNPEWVNSLSNEECIGVICHEISHLVFLHLIRRGSRQPTKWNIAADLVINGMLNQNGFSLPKGGLIPQGYNHEFTINGKKLTDLNKKCAEEVSCNTYEECCYW